MTIKPNQLADNAILLVDDDVNFLRLMEVIFRREGLTLLTALDGQQGLQQFFDHQPSLVILDLMLPVLDGWQTCQRIREISSVPIIILTALSGQDNIIRGLDEARADDYLIKPVEVEVFMAKIRALLRRAALPPELADRRGYDDGYLTLDLSKQQVLVQGQPVKLTVREYQLLVYLYRYADRVQPHRQILQDLWGEQETHSVDVIHKNIRRLRQKLKEDPNQPRYILTEYGIGYRFRKYPFS